MSDRRPSWFFTIMSLITVVLYAYSDVSGGGRITGWTAWSLLFVWSVILGIQVGLWWLDHRDARKDHQYEYLGKVGIKVTSNVPLDLGENWVLTSHTTKEDTP